MSGRGGAGNILAQQQALERVAADVEAAVPKQVTSVGPADLPNSPRENQPYAYTGRGGAGNYYVPKDLEQQGQFVNADRSHILGDGTAAPESAVPAARVGRGGAGNFAVGQAEVEELARKKRAEEELLRGEKVKADAKDAADGIAVPEKAKTLNEKQGL